MPSGRPQKTGRMRSNWSWRPRRDACLNCSRCATGAWSAPRSPSTGARPSRWRPTWRRRRPPGSGSSAAGTRTCATSADSPPRSGRSSSPSTTSTRRCPAPWEWDVKRLAASFVVACRDNGLSEAVAKDVVMTCVRTYRESMAEFSQMKTLELWYRALGSDELLASLPPKLRKRVMKRIEKEQAKSRGEEMFPKLVEQQGGHPVIKDQLPTIFHHEDHPPGRSSRPCGTRSPRTARRCPPPTSPCWTATSSGTPPSRWSGSAASGPAAGCSSSRPGTATPSSSRSRKRAPRSWSRTRARASSRTTASASWTATGACSPRATCSSGGAGGRSATSSSASCGT